MVRGDQGSVLCPSDLEPNPASLHSSAMRVSVGEPHVSTPHSRWPKVDFFKLTGNQCCNLCSSQEKHLLKGAIVRKQTNKMETFSVDKTAL